MLWRDRRAPLAAVVILAAYAAMLLTGIGWAGQMSLGWPEVRLGETLRLLHGFDTALLVWRIGMRSYFTTRCYGRKRIASRPARRAGRWEEHTSELPTLRRSSYRVIDLTKIHRIERTHKQHK